MKHLIFTQTSFFHFILIRKKDEIVRRSANVCCAANPTFPFHILHLQDSQSNKGYALYNVLLCMLWWIRLAFSCELERALTTFCNSCELAQLVSGTRCYRYDAAMGRRKKIFRTHSIQKKLINQKVGTHLDKSVPI